MPSLLKPSKFDKEKSNNHLVTMGEVEKKAEDAKNFLSRVLGDINKASATKQIVLGASSGWATGYLAMRVGKTAALALGGGIILLQIANEKGYIKINWDKVNTNINKVADKVEEKISGEGPSNMDKAERFLDRKVNQATDKLKKQQKKAKKWYSKITGDENEEYRLKEVHIFLVSFLAGIAIGIGSA